MSIQGINVQNLRPIIGSNLSVYSGINLKSSPKIWNGYVTTNPSGQAIFYPTDNGAVNGNAIFLNIYSINILASSGTNSAASIPTASLKEVNFGNKEIVSNIIVGNTIGILGTVANSLASTGVGVYCTIFGE